MKEGIEICEGTFKVWDRGDRHAEISTAVKPRLLSARMLASQDEVFAPCRVFWRPPISSIQT